ncbi:Ig domain-containing protein [Streptomyces sp. NPDC017991]|uniref:Ig domain-containing protein n=1 Tax=Streptomyces sp. NPDC017991 TaxID=3365026 RepID=UPI0037BD2E74
MNAENARLTGRGVISGSDGGIKVAFSRNIEIDGVLVLDPRSGYACAIGQSRQVTVRALHAYSSGRWGDGIDVLQHREPQIPYQGCFALNPGDNNLMRGVRIQDVRVEDFTWGQLINMRVMANRYTTAPGRGVEDVYVRDLTYEGTRASTAILTGYDAQRPVKNVTFQYLTVNGTVVHDAMRKPGWFLTTDMVPMFAGEHVHDLRFLDESTAAATTAPAITGAGEATAVGGHAFCHLITASALPTSFDAEGLPKGLAVDRATGLISGTPEMPGDHTVTVSATNAVGTATEPLELTVHSP